MVEGKGIKKDLLAQLKAMLYREQLLKVSGAKRYIHNHDIEVLQAY